MQIIKMNSLAIYGSHHSGRFGRGPSSSTENIAEGCPKSAAHHCYDNDDNDYFHLVSHFVKHCVPTLSIIRKTNMLIVLETSLPVKPASSASPANRSQLSWYFSSSDVHGSGPLFRQDLKQLADY